MGRWAQRRLGNGGGGSGPAPISIISASLHSGDNETIDVTFSGDISDADFAGGDFEAQPPFINALVVANLASNVLEVGFGTDVSAATDLAYSGTAPNVSTPQTVPIT